MAQIMAIDYGKKRCGIAVTDDMQIIASGLPTVETSKLMVFLQDYFTENSVEGVVLGLPRNLKGDLNDLEKDIQNLIISFQSTFPILKIYRLDERFTSKMASYYIAQSGKSKKDRENKSLIDKVSATILLQDFLANKNV